MKFYTVRIHLHLYVTIYSYMLQLTSCI